MHAEKKHLLYKIFLKNRCSENEMRYKLYRNKLTCILKTERKKYYGDKLIQLKNDIKGTWKFLNSVIRKNSVKETNNVFMKDGNIGPTLASKIPSCDECWGLADPVVVAGPRAPLLVSQGVLSTRR